MANESGTEVITKEAAATAAPAAPARYGGGGPGGQRGGGRGGFGGGRGGGGFGGGRGRRPEGGDQGFDGSKGEELVEKVVFINRSSKVVKGGRRFKFSALVVVGDKKGRVGYALGKAAEVADAIRRAGELARRQMTSVSLKDATIPHEIYSEYEARVFYCGPLHLELA